MLTREKEVRLPTSSEELDSFVGTIIKNFKLPDGDEVYEAIATTLLHMDNRIGQARPSYFANCAVKYLANKAAYDRIESFNAKRKLEAEAKKEKTPDNTGADGVSH